MGRGASADKAALFHAAVAVRQIEIGLASMTSLLFGVTGALYGIALFREPRLPRWVGALGIIGGAVTAVAGIVMAYAGFSATAMMISMPSTSLLLVWMIALGVYGWRRGIF